MNVTALFEKIAGRQQERQHQQVESYRELVAAIAVGEEPDAETVERALAGAGKSLDDLRQSVELYLRRMALKATAAMVPQLEQDRKAVQQQVAEADRVLEDAERRHNEATAPLHARLREIAQAMSDASDAKRGLFATCDDPTLRQQLEKVTAEIDRLSAEQRILVDRAVSMEDKARSEHGRAKRELTEADIESRHELAAHCEKDAKLARRETKMLEKAIAELVRRRDQIEQRMREW